MAEFPALPLFTDAFIADTGHLDATETGAYLALLMAAWRSPDCSIPDDDIRLARMARCDRRTWSRVKDTVMAFWKKEEDGKLRQKRLTRERTYVSSISRRQSLAGKASALKRKELASTSVPTTRQPNVNPHTHTHTHIVSPPPNGGADSARAPRDPRSDFEVWEQALLAVDGVRGSKLEISSMHPVAALHREGFDLSAEIIPQLKADLAAAKQGDRLSRLSWATLARKIREARLEPASARPEQARDVELDWTKRLGFARSQRTWDVKNWGPMPGRDGCRVPAQDLAPGDGDGWTEWRAAS